MSKLSVLGRWLQAETKLIEQGNKEAKAAREAWDKVSASKGLPSRQEMLDKELRDCQAQQILEMGTNPETNLESNPPSKEQQLEQEQAQQPNSIFDPELATLATRMAMFHIEAGARKLVEFATVIIKEFGATIIPYIKAAYESARYALEGTGISEAMDEPNFVNKFDLNTLKTNKNEQWSELDVGNNSNPNQAEIQKLLKLKRNHSAYYR